jgi:hypothetical protein
MSNTVILFYAIGVFTLMLVGIFLTAQEFKKLSDEQARSRDQRKTDGGLKEVQQKTERPARADIRVVHRNNAA